MPDDVWVGTQAHHGVAAEPRKDLQPPPHWRLEAVAATPRPRDPVVSAVTRACHWRIADLVDGATESLNGVAAVFVSGAMAVQRPFNSAIWYQPHKGDRHIERLRYPRRKGSRHDSEHI